MTDEMNRLKDIASDNRNPKAVKASALSRLRAMEEAAGVESIPYNSPTFTTQSY